MLTGREETLLACLLMGADGCMTATAGIFPEIMVGIYKAWQEGDLDKALKLQKMILVVIRTMFAAPFPIGFKLALELRGIEMGPPLIPPSAADTYQINTVKSRLKMLMEPMIEKHCTVLEIA
jgi:dihydrodipicolinate synthase/N-acetylneuraminate lyase